jgi:hypothetical protein
MPIKQHRIYYASLLLCLTAVFVPNIALRIAINLCFPIISFLLYFQSRKNLINLKDKFFLGSICATFMQDLFVVWRLQKWLMLIGIFFLYMMSILFIQAVRQEKQYLILGKNKPLLRLMIIIAVSVLFFTTIFLPVTPGFFIFPIFLHCFSLFFAFLVAINRQTNEQSYWFVISGMILFIITTIIVGTSLFISDFPFSYFCERLCFMLGISFVTQGVLKSYGQEKMAE